MANQIVVSAGAKVRNLDGVLTGTSGVVNSLPINASNGIPQLDVNGKILVSQLPNSVMEYKGTWNVSTNTPTLANGTGNQGDVYLVEGAAVGGTAFNFGAGPITFFNGDQAIYSGSIWQRGSGATGSVTSVAVTESGDSLNITGSPITTSGTINIGFNGTNLQYINGAGNLVTFPSIAAEAQRLITEVYNETGATLSKGTVVYINGGHGNLPTITKAIATGDATSAQTYGIVQTDITNNNNGYVVVIGSLTDLDTQAYPDGTQLYLSSTTAGAWTSTKQYAPAHLVYVGIVVRSHPTQGVVEVRIQNGFEMDELHNVSAQSPLNNQGLFYNSSTSLWENKSIATALGYTPADDSLVVHLAGTETITGEKTFTNVNGTQFDYGIVSLLSSRFDQGIIFKKGTVPTIFNNIFTNLYTEATSNNLVIQDVNSKAKLIFNNSTQTYTFPNASGTIALVGGSGVGTVTSVAALTIGTSGTDLSSTVATSTTTPVITLNVPTASASNRGALSSADWTIFNNKQNALTNPVTGTGTTNYLPKFTGASTIGNSLLVDNGTNVYLGNVDGGGKALVINGTGVTSATIYYDSTGKTYGLYQTGTQSNFLTGNLGLGVTPSAWSGTDVRAFDISLRGSLSAGGTDVSVVNNAYYNGSSWIYKQSDLASYYQQISGVHRWFNAPSGTAGNAISFTQAMTLTAGGYLVLGASTSTYGQAGRGTFEMNGSADNIFVQKVNGTLQMYIYTTASGTNEFWSSNTLAINSTAGNVTLNTNGTPRLTIANSTGAASFSSSVTATSYNRAAAGTGFLNGKYGSAESVSTTGPIYCIGDSYVPTSTSINSMFGIGYSYNQFTGKFGPADTWGMYVATNGSVGVFLAGGGAGYFAGAVTATGFFESSDKRIKTLIEDNYQTKGIGEITPKLYTKNGKVELGYYAQDFVGILDSAISKIDDGMLNLSYREVHTAKIYALEQRIKELENK